MEATHTRPRRDSCVVDTVKLAGVVKAFIAAKHTPPGFHPLDWISERTRDGNPHGRGVSRRLLTRLVKEERPYTDLLVADAVLVAIHRIDALYDGTLEVIPNPVSRECCTTYQPNPLIAALASL